MMIITMAFAALLNVTAILLFRSPPRVAYDPVWFQASVNTKTSSAAIPRTKN